MGLTYKELENSMKTTFFEKYGENPDKNSFEEKVIEALACELFSLSCQSDFILKQSFVQTATGRYLDMLGEMRDCVRKEETNAIGVLKFYNAQATEEDIQIKKGTICSVYDKPYIQFETTSNAVISAGELYVEVPARALDSGEEYNVLPGEITVMVNAPVKVENVINESGFEGGNDIESDNSYRERIIRNYTIPANGIGKTSIENKICKLDYIADCKIHDAKEPGKIQITVAVRDGESLTSTRSEEMEKCIGFAGIVGADVVFTEATKLSLNVTADVSVVPSADKDKTSDFVNNVISEMFSERKIGKSISVSKIAKEILKNEDVSDVALYCGKIVNGEFVCPSESFLKLNSLVVNCNYE